MEHKHNEYITDDTVMVVYEDGTSEVLDTDDALRQAYDNDLDLVVVAENATPKVAKMMDYKKFLYEQKRQKKEQRRNTKRKDQKEIQIKPQIQENDLKIKVNKVVEFLEDGHTVKVTVRLRGREKSLYKLDKILEDFLTNVESSYKVISGSTTTGTIIIGK